jgi:hypothetical protein
MVRQQLLPELDDEAVRSARAATKGARAPHREPGAEADARLSSVTRERDEARNGRALAEQLLVSLLRQPLPGWEPV